MKYNSTNRVGFTRKYKTPEEMAEAINEYFEECEREIPKLDADGNPIFYRGAQIFEKEATPITTSGLALALGFKNRASLQKYLGYDKTEKPDARVVDMPEYESDGFRDIILKAYSICEKYAEERLYDKEGSTGAKFSLENCDKRWSEGKNVNLAVDTPKDIVSAEEALKRLEMLGFNRYGQNEGQLQSESTLEVGRADRGNRELHESSKN